MLNTILMTFYVIKPALLENVNIAVPISEYSVCILNNTWPYIKLIRYRI